ncbi:MAG TPA: phosphoribosylglycinamide formyltransferase [Burkholderiales bacterium]|nr:phosphoribosylglycinamide formyltransferase [Burkholderiales bacterium]
MPSRLAVLASGRGSNLQAIIDHFDGLGRLARVVLVASNRRDSNALSRASAASIPAVAFTADDDGTQLLSLLREHRVDLVILAGYLKRIPSSVIEEFAGRILNVHPALLPDFGGEGMYGRRVHEAVLAAKADQTGVTVHLVDNDYDRGPIVARWIVPVLPGDDAATLAARVLEVEHIVYPRAVEMVAALHEHGFVAT